MFKHITTYYANNPAILCIYHKINDHSYPTDILELIIQIYTSRA